MPMNSAPIQRFSLPAFLILTPLLTFAITLLPLAPDVLPLLMVCIPALMASLLAVLTEGREGIVALWGRLRHWRISVKWYAITLGLALGIRLAMAVMALVVGWIPTIQLRPWPLPLFLGFGVILLLSAALAEVGWRAYALPRLLATRSALVSALLIGILWGLVHLGLHLPGMIYAGTPWVATLLEIVGFSVVITWLFIQTRGNIVVTSVFHAAQSFFVIVNEGLTVTQQLWLMAVVYLALALILVLIFGAALQSTPVKSVVVADTR